MLKADYPKIAKQAFIIKTMETKNSYCMSNTEFREEFQGKDCSES